jgi:hypothetical protein
MAGVNIGEWAGLVTAASPYRVPPGGNVAQNNLQIVVPGQMQQRLGSDTIYTALDYDEVVGVYRIANGSTVANGLVISSKPSTTRIQIRALNPGGTGADTDWSSVTILDETNSFAEPPSLAEDRHGRLHLFCGNGISPRVFNRSGSGIQLMGLPAPTVSPTVTPSGNGYFIERVDVLDGGGSYWKSPAVIVTGGGTPLISARLKTVIQGGSVVAVDVIDGGAGYTSPPVLTVDESGVKGTGFLGYGIIGVDPGIQGFLPTVSTTATLTNGSAVANAIANGGSFKVGMNIRGTGIPGSTTISVVTNSTTATMSANYSGTTGTVAIVVSGAVVSGSTDTALSHGYDLTPDATTVAYWTGSATAGAAATWDSTTSRWTALIPLTPGSGVTPTATAFAQVQFSQLSSFTGALYRVTSSSTAPSVSGSQSVASAFFSTSTNTLLSPSQPNPGSYYAADYWVNTDDSTQAPGGSGSAAGYYQFYRFFRNNHDYFAGLVPRFRIVFHKRREVERRYRNPAGSGGYVTWADLYALDYNQISYRYFTGAKDEIGGAQDIPSRWTWGSSPVGVANGQPYIDITLEPTLKTGTTAYATYTGNRKPVVRVYLKYCPDSWLNALAGTAGESFTALNLGWQRTGAGSSLTSSTNLGWWDGGSAENGPPGRPIVDFRAGSAGNASAGVAAGTVEVVDPGDGWEENTFFAIQFDQINAGYIYSTFNSENTTQYNHYFSGGSGNPWRHQTGNQSSYDITVNDLDWNPTSPGFSSEYARILNSTRSYASRTFTDYRLRFYFQAKTQSTTQPGPPGVVVGEPSVVIPGAGYLDGNTASLKLRQRSNLTDPASTATFSDGQTYTFKAVRQTAATTTNTITSVSIANAGTGYYGSPSLIVTGGGGFGLKVSPTVSSGVISAVNIEDAGGGYSSSPTLTTSSDTAKLLPVMRAAMRGVYRCAYRFADYSQNVVVSRAISATSGSAVISASTVSDLAPGMVVEHPAFPWMTKIVSIGTSASPLQLVLSQAATITSSDTCLFRDFTRPTYYSSFSPIADVDTLQFTAAPNPTQMLWSLPGVSAPTRATHVEFFRTSADESLVFYRLEMYGTVDGTSVNIKGIDTLTDEQLFDADRPFYAAVPVVLPNGGLNAYRFGVPRSDMSVCTAYGDRLWYGVSTSGQDVNSIFFSEFDEFESCPAEYEISIQNNQRTTDSITALVPFSSFLLAMQTSHCYAISYNTDPTVDVSIQMIAQRGCLSQHCHDLYDNTLFAMDERGIYAMNRSGSVESLSDPISDLFQNNLLDLTIRKRFFLKVDPRTAILRAFVALAGQGARSPTLALCYSFVTKAWWTESWPNGLTCAAAFRFVQNDADECVYGAVDGDVYRFTGFRDQQYRSIQSVTITNGGAGYTTAPTVTVAAGQAGAGARFTALVRDGVVTEILIVESGYGYGDTSTTPFTSAVTLSISAPPAGGTQAVATATAVAPELADNVYPQATVPVTMKTGAFTLINDANIDQKTALIDRSVTVIYRPTETSTELTLREYFNNSSAPRVNVMPRDRGTGFTSSTSGAKTSLDMIATRSPLGLATGVAKAAFAGRNLSDQSGADRHVAIELSVAARSANSGDTEPARVVLYGLDVNGVVPRGE